ncbi:MAG: TIGR04282 family arsenosugar biosynthesis glycosyltransferase [Gammaproteobacteria bacterium]|nr:TIGR04282 family arsenosugar biosynthesis glycosyltransferase [Gammaproteobacteria bacterium]
MLYDDSVILLYAKAPVEGKVNTRLAADIGVPAATRLQYDLIHHRLSMLTKANLCDVHLMCAPSQQDENFIQCKKQYPITLLDQSGDCLGERMFNGVASALQRYRYCIVIGTDAPALDEVRVKQAIEALHAGTDVAIVPAEDGGYVLIAMQQAHRFLFQKISWGSAEVMSQTRDRLNENNVSYEEFASCWDIDRLEDYQRYLAIEGKG